MSDSDEVDEALLDGCDGDAEGLRAALGAGYTVERSTGYNEGWGHHSYNTIYRTADGKLIHAECGGCSCEGSGSWSYVDTPEEAEKLIPEDQR